MNARPTHKLLATTFLVSLSATLSAQSPEPAPPAGETKIQVFVYNYAAVAPATLARAERLAGRIYGHVGIQTEFLDCPLTPAEAAQFPACQLPVAPSRLALRVLSRTMSERIGLTQATFGSALFPPDGGLGMIAQVCAYCSEQMAKGSEEMYAVILGHIMAHELGHLLLGVGSHGATGLMHVPWNHKELDMAAQGTLLFTSWEAERMRRNAAERIAASSTLQVAGK